VSRHRGQWAVVSTLLQIEGASLKTGIIWNYGGAVMYYEEESVSRGCLSTSTGKESSVKLRQITRCRNE